MTRLTQRMQRLEARWRPKSIAADLQRVPACPPAALRACLLDEFPSVSLRWTVVEKSISLTTVST